MEAAEPSTPPPKKGRSEPKCKSTPTITDQGDTDTCRFHTLSKMIIHAVFDPFLTMNDDEETDYKNCMPLKTPTERAYSRGTCSEKSYVKIMLFYYFFYLGQQLDGNIKGRGIQELLTMPRLNPSKDSVDERSIAGLRQVKGPWFGYQIQMEIVHLPSVLENVIKPLLKLGLYVELGLETEPEESYDSDEEVVGSPDKHIVLITGADGDHVTIKNSWGTDETVHLFDDVVKLEDEHFRLMDIFFILPYDFNSRVTPYNPMNYVYDPRNIAELYDAIARISPSTEGGKKRKTKYGQRRNHYQSKTIRAGRKRTKTHYTRRLSKH